MIKKSESIQSNIKVFQEAFLETNMGIVETLSSYLIIDSLYKAKDFKEIISELKKEKRKLVFLTHGHSSHIYGLSLLHEPELIFASQETYDYINDNFKNDWEEWKEIDPDLQKVEKVLPNVTYQSPFQLTIDGVKIKFISTPGHSKDSTSIFFPGYNVLFAGDALLTPNDVPSFEENESLIAIESLKKMRKIDAEQYVPGHGKVVGKKGVDDNIYYIERIRARVKNNIDEFGKKGFGKKIPLHECIKEDFDLFWPELHQWNVNRAYNEYLKKPW